MVYKWLRTIRNLVYPPTCLLCDDPGEGDLDLCAGCRRDLPWNTNPCPACACPLPPGESGRCASCVQNPPEQDGAFAPFVYQTPMDSLLTGVKFHARLGTSRILGQLFAKSLQDHAIPYPDRILPVPLHHLRLLQRGYNQAAELARPVARQTRTPLDIAGARRTRRTRQQSRLHADQRRANIHGAFRARRDFRGLHIAIMDDIVTTGRTAEELARTLKRAGAARVTVWSVARVPHD